MTGREKTGTETRPVLSQFVALLGGHGFTVLTSSPSQAAPGGRDWSQISSLPFPRTWMGSGPQWKLEICSINGWMDERMMDGSGWMEG